MAKPCLVPEATRVLVVDDEPEIVQLIGDMLEAAGYQVELCHSGDEALRRLRKMTVDAIVSDLRMPDTDGPALWRAVAQEHPELARRMLFVTGDTLSAAAQSFLGAAGCAHMDKPFSKKDLLRKLSALLH
jgi:CheY-like chemotaxis protein